MRGHHTGASPVLLLQPKAPPCALTPFPTLFFSPFSPHRGAPASCRAGPTTCSPPSSCRMGLQEAKIGLRGKNSVLGNKGKGCKGAPWT